ncbi:MAG TPA: YqaA family protein [Vicinamibacterales bacterium]|nr:YqaA family protein [Vicinamibacterales bacterium]
MSVPDLPGGAPVPAALPGRGVLAAPRRWVRAMYDWTMHWADTPQSLMALTLIAVAESSAFPIPPDVLLIAIVAANAHRWLTAAALCTAGSVVGAVIGYYIGSALMVTVGQPIVDFYQAQRYWDQVVALYQGTWGVWFLAAAAFTPIPYKVATIAAGATAMPFWPFVLVSIIGRGGRFFVVAAILRIFGPSVRALIERHFDTAAILFLVLLIGGFVVLRYL